MAEDALSFENFGVILVQKQLTAIIEREGNGYVSLCPQLDIASQGDTVQEARDNLREALELFFEVASPSEIRIGTLQSIIRQFGISKSDF